MEPHDAAPPEVPDDGVPPRVAGEDLALSDALGFHPAYGLERIRNLSDAVFAVAMTLAVLNFRLPHTTDSDAALTTALLQQWPRYVAYLAGFAVVGWCWFNHHRLFELLVRADGTLLWLNLTFLLTVVVTPFTILVLGEVRGVGLAHLLFDLNATLLGLTGALLWRYATRDHRLVADELEPQALAVYRARAWVFPAVFLLAALLVPVSPVLAAAAWLLLPLGRWPVAWLVGPMPATERRAEDEEPVPDDGAPRTRREARARSGLARLMAFSDNVYAFALTVLVLRFKVPQPPPETDAALRALLVDKVWPDVFELLLGYLVTGLFWHLHLRTFMIIQAVDPPLVALNLVHLLAVALIPFGTQLLAEYNDVSAAVVVYAGIGALVGATLALIVAHSTRHHRLVDRRLPEEGLRLRRTLWWSNPVGFLLSMPVALVAPGAAEVLWLGSFLLARLLARRSLTTT